MKHYLIQLASGVYLVCRDNPAHDTDATAPEYRRVAGPYRSVEVARSVMRRLGDQN